MPIDTNGIHQYEEAEPASPFSTMLNRLAASTSSAIGQLRSTLAAIGTRLDRQDQYSLAQGWVLIATAAQASVSSGTANISGWTASTNSENRYGFNTSNGVVTIPEDGLYMIHYRVGWTAPAGCLHSAQTAGVFERFAQTVQGYNSAERRVASTLCLPLSAGAQFRVQSYSSAAGTGLTAMIEVRRIG